jgi:hypothetical protein
MYGTVREMPGKHSIDLYEKNGYTGNIAHNRKVLQSRSLSGGVHHWFNRNTRKERIMMMIMMITIIIIIIINFKSPGPSITYSLIRLSERIMS